MKLYNITPMFNITPIIRHILLILLELSLFPFYELCDLSNTNNTKFHK